METCHLQFMTCSLITNKSQSFCFMNSTLSLSMLKWNRTLKLPSSEKWKRKKKKNPNSCKKATRIPPISIFFSFPLIFVFKTFYWYSYTLAHESPPFFLPFFPSKSNSHHSGGWKSKNKNINKELSTSIVFVIGSSYC